jgi:hypothetical protein
MTAVYHLASTSIFCIITPEDVPTRKAVFDTVLLGCIPVFFDQLTAPLMYEWHWGQDLWQKASVNLENYKEDLVARSASSGSSGNNSSSGIDVVDLLVKMFHSDRKTVEGMQDLIERHAFQLQYSIPTATRSGEPHTTGSRRGSAGIEGTTSTGSRNEDGKRASDYSNGSDNSNGNGIGIEDNTSLDAFDIAMETVLLIHSGVRTHARRSHYVVCERMKTFRHGEICRSTDSTRDHRND